MRAGAPAAVENDVPRACDLRGLAALAFYLGLSIIFFGRQLLGHPSTFYIGVGSDPVLMMWLLVWWPHAIAHGLNPVLTHALWAPSGFNLTRGSSIPLASIIASPLTLMLGPVAAYNVLCLFSVAFDAWCAFVLCRYLTGSYWTSLLGGYLFGFSSFILGQLLLGHLHLLLIFPVPLAVYVAVRRFAGEITENRFIALFALLLVSEFLLSLEIFATMTVFASLALLLGWASATGETRKRILALITSMGYAYAASLTLVSPYLYYFFAFRPSSQLVWSPSSYAADLLNFVVPTQTNELGRIPLLRSVAATFPGRNIGESGAYFGLPSIAIIALYGFRRWREPLGRLLIDLVIIAGILSLGPSLHAAGRKTSIYLPWRLFELPVLHNSYPARLSIYAFLALALIASQWLATINLKLAFKLGVAAALIAFNVPNLSTSFWVRGDAGDTPMFFRAGLYRHYLREGEIAVVLPYGGNGNNMLWQAETNMYFAMPQRGTGGEIEHVSCVARAFLRRTYLPDAGEQLRTFLAAHDVSAIVVADSDVATWQKLLSTLAITPVDVGGVSLYRIPAEALRSWAKPRADMRTRFDGERLLGLVTSAQKYLADRGDLKSLTVLKAVDLNLIPQDSLLGPLQLNLASPDPRSITDPRFAYGVWLGAWPGGRVSVGEYVWGPGVKAIIGRLRGFASKVYFPFLGELTGDQPGGNGWLLIVFTPEQLPRAAAVLKASLADETSSAGRSAAP